jgi:hypothetical protein
LPNYYIVNNKLLGKIVIDILPNNIGKDVPEVRDALNDRIRQRKEYQAKLHQVRENLMEVKRALRGKRA